ARIGGGDLRRGRPGRRASGGAARSSGAREGARGGYRGSAQHGEFTRFSAAAAGADAGGARPRADAGAEGESEGEGENEGENEKENENEHDHEHQTQTENDSQHKKGPSRKGESFEGGKKAALGRQLPVWEGRTRKQPPEGGL
ncbi:MAG: hypothetical protein LC689_04655, partial [Myxococcales bacterium]|nr:hypothetical protein [Myxococcales bacterium]